MPESPNSKSSRGPRETFLFADLCGFTEYTAAHGDELAADLAISFHRQVHAFAVEEGCDLVKCIGDAVMIHSADCRTAVRLAQRILALGGCEGRPHIRIGIDSGPAVERAGDWYGDTVNIAARVTDAATAGELLLTQRARDEIAATARACLVARGNVRLKGLPALAVHSARPPVAAEERTVSRGSRRLPAVNLPLARPSRASARATVAAP